MDNLVTAFISAIILFFKWLYTMFINHPRLFLIGLIIIIAISWILYRRIFSSPKSKKEGGVWESIIDSIRHYSSEEEPAERQNKRNDKIAGLDSQLEEIKRQIKIPRSLPKNIKEKLELRDVKGIILHGPPGTGKTMMARNIADHLGCKSFVKKAAVSLLNKYYGESESNLRQLFRHEPGKLHMVVLDEIETICGKRGGLGNEGKFYSSLTNQLLSLMDGLDHDPDIIVVGTTNRLSDIDEAILRKGRFDLQIKIDLPDEKAREDIINIYSDHLIKDELMEPFDVKAMVERTKGLSGADIENMFREAKTSAVYRYYDTNDKILITETDLIEALRK